MAKQTNFTAASFGGSKRAEAKEAAAEAVPSGSVKEVLAWIGDNEDRAARALDAEYERDEPRVTVIEGIEKVIELEEE